MPRFARLALAASGLALMLGACAPAAKAPVAAVAVADAAVTRSDAGLTLSWTTTPAGAPVDVFVVPLTGEPRLISDDDADGTHTLTLAEAAQRPVLRVVSPSGAVQTVAERLLPLEGGRNFRDLGGYAGADGRLVKWGQIYRSGTMANLTPADLATLNQLGVRTICDFRAVEERTREPTNWQGIHPDVVYQTRDYVSDTTALRAIFASTPTPEIVKAQMTALYRELPYEHADSYRTMFRDITEGRLPMAFNCSAGKDRTGVAAALVLTVLGVDRATILQDYAMSERMVDYEREYRAAPGQTAPAAAADNPYAFLARLSPEVRAPLMRSDPAYLSEALAEMERRSGSVEGYLKTVIGLDDAALATVREKLLEPAVGA